MATFRLQNLLHKNKDGKITGAIAPVAAARDFAFQMQITCSGLFRVWFDDEMVHNVYEGKGNKERTGYDTLIIVSQYPNVVQLAMFIDGGSSGTPVGIWFSNDNEPVTLTPAYENKKYHKKPSDEELEEIFQECVKQWQIVKEKLYVEA
jgi:hypothetical protein